MAKQLGASQDLLDAMFNIDQHRDEFTAAELAALTLAERMTTDARNVDEEVWAELRAHFDDGQIIELASVIGLFNYFNRFNDALRVEITPPGRPPASPASEWRHAQPNQDNTMPTHKPKASGDTPPPADERLRGLLADLTQLQQYLSERGDHTYELAQRFLANAKRDSSSRAYDERQATMLEYQHYIWREIAGRVNKLVELYGDSNQQTPEP